uniref:Uncharacterized protein n=1 Tax=Anguilla anguilla TaxID=7936 RepID=A0A0E9VHE2_ANGAN
MFFANINVFWVYLISIMPLCYKIAFLLLQRVFLRRVV